MSEVESLAVAERKVFRTAKDDGLWDILLGCVVCMFAVAPLLSGTLGDFWSSCIFVPFWAVVWGLSRWVRRNHVEPRLGAVEFGSERKARMTRFALFMLAFNIVALALGGALALRPGSVALPPFLIFSLLALAGLSIAGYALDCPRLYFYGLLLAAAPAVGELLYSRLGVFHHGFPVTFGISTLVIWAVGLARLRGVLRLEMVVVEEH